MTEIDEIEGVSVQPIKGGGVILHLRGTDTAVKLTHNDAVKLSADLEEYHRKAFANAFADYIEKAFYGRSSK